MQTVSAQLCKPIEFSSYAEALDNPEVAVKIKIDAIITIGSEVAALVNLEEIEFQTDAVIRNLSPEFYELPKLKRIIIGNKDLTAFPDRDYFLQHLYLFPALESITCAYTIPTQNKPALHLTEMAVGGFDRNVDGKTFPNLKHLVISSFDSTLFRRFPYLEYLSLYNQYKPYSTISCGPLNPRDLGLLKQLKSFMIEGELTATDFDTMISVLENAPRLEALTITCSIIDAHHGKQSVKSGKFRALKSLAIRCNNFYVKRFTETKNLRVLKLFAMENDSVGQVDLLAIPNNVVLDFSRLVSQAGHANEILSKLVLQESKIDTLTIQNFGSSFFYVWNNDSIIDLFKPLASFISLKSFHIHGCHNFPLEPGLRSILILPYLNELSITQVTDERGLLGNKFSGNIQKLTWYNNNVDATVARSVLTMESIQFARFDGILNDIDSMMFRKNIACLELLDGQYSNNEMLFAVKRKYPQALVVYRGILWTPNKKYLLDEIRNAPGDKLDAFGNFTTLVWPCGYWKIIRDKRGEVKGMELIEPPKNHALEVIRWTEHMEISTHKIRPAIDVKGGTPIKWQRSRR